MLTLYTLYATWQISWPTVVDGVLGRATKGACDTRLSNWAAKITRAAVARLNVMGREHMQPGAAYLIMSNHQSHFDIPILFHALGSDMRMIGKSELFRVPVFGGALRHAGFIEIDRSNRHRALESLERAKSLLRRGTSVWMAPEGTRSPSGELLSFKKGGFVLAMDAGWPILPVSIQGTRDILPARGVIARRAAEVRVTVHEPIHPSSPADAPSPPRDSRRLLMARVRDAISKAV
jgi:1-acyl-sn-glycerol-3-phosphate acyltransferase